MIPDRKYLVHKAVEPEKLTKVGRAGMEEARELADTAVQWKYDGCNCIAILPKPGVCELYSRTGELVRSMRHIEQQLLATFPVQKYGPTVVLGEAWVPGLTQQEISGLFRKHSDSPELEFVAFDLMPLSDFEAGTCDTTWKHRWMRLESIVNLSATPCRLAQTYMQPELAGGWQVIHDELMARHPIGFDGVIERDKEAPWIAGTGTGGGIVKHKLRPSLDLVVVAVEEGQKANAGKVGNLVVQLSDGVTQGVGTGISAAQRAEWWADPTLIVGAIVEVSYLSKTLDGKLREPAFEGIRYDKEEADQV